MAKFGKTHGISGSITIQSFFKIKKDILNYNQFYLKNNELLNIQISQKQNNFYARIKNILSPEDAKKYTGKLIFIKEQDLPKLKKKQFYFNQLERMTVFIQNTNIGYVKKVNSHGAGEYLEISNKNSELLVPFNFDHILEVDTENNKIYLNPNYYEI